MGVATARLLSQFEALPLEEKEEFIQEAIRIAPLDSGPLDDEEVAMAGDWLAKELDQEENDAQKG